MDHLKSQTKPPDTQPNPIRQCLQACSYLSMVSSSLFLLSTPITHTPRPVTQRETPLENSRPNHAPPPPNRPTPSSIHPSSDRTTQHTTPDPNILAAVVFRRAVLLGGFLCPLLLLFTCVSAWRICAALPFHCTVPISCFFSFDTKRLRVSSLMRGCNSENAQFEKR